MSHCLGHGASQLADAEQASQAPGTLQLIPCKHLAPHPSPPAALPPSTSHQAEAPGSQPGLEKSTPNPQRTGNIWLGHIHYGSGCVKDSLLPSCLSDLSWLSWVLLCPEMSPDPDWVLTPRPVSREGEIPCRAGPGSQVVGVVAVAGQRQGGGGQAGFWGIRGKKSRQQRTHPGETEVQMSRRQDTTCCTIPSEVTRETPNQAYYYWEFQDGTRRALAPQVQGPFEHGPWLMAPLRLL